MTQPNNAELAAFRAVDFDWATRLDEVWRDPAFDVPELHRDVRDEFENKIKALGKQPPGKGKSPLGWVVLGAGGSGKTHLLGAMRREAAQKGAAFVLVDMTDVRNFWETVLQGYLNSLQAEYGNGQFQYQVLLKNFIQYLGLKQPTEVIFGQLAKRKSKNLNGDIQGVIEALHKKYPPQTMQHQDIVRALICLNSEDFGVANAGLAYLQALPIDEELHQQLAFHKTQEEPRNIVRALSWLMGLCGPSVVAFDQLDPIVRLLDLSSMKTEEARAEQHTALGIINEIGNGLATMIDLTTNTLNIVSCVEATWDRLKNHVMSSNTDRFPGFFKLNSPNKTELFTALIRQRLQIAYKDHSFTPPFPTWPFSSQVIESLTSETPREVLQLCEAHRKRCIAAGEVSELSTFPIKTDQETPEDLTDQFAKLEQQFEEFQKQAQPNELLDEKYEDERLAPLFQMALQCLIREHESSLTPDVDAIVEKDFPGGKSTKPLHARLRLVFPKENSREEHFCVRALQRKNHSAFKTRLKAAMTQSGIDKSLKFRHLLIVRAAPPPGGAQTETLIDRFKEQGGRFHEPAEHEIRVLFALQKLQEQNHPHFESWLQNHRPVTRLGLNEVLAPGSRLNGAQMQKSKTQSTNDNTTQGKESHQTEKEATNTSTTDATNLNTGADQSALTASSAESVSTGSKKSSSETSQSTKRDSSATTEETAFPIGNRIMGLGKIGELVTVPLGLLTRHTLILGGAGSGKSVTVRRIIEEAALLGIPAIVVDGANDMAYFDEAWPEDQEHWREGDRDRADRFHQIVEQIVWTPGSLSSGNPMSLRPLPDFSPVKDDAEELQDAIMMARDGLREIVAPGKSQKSQNKDGILVNSLRYFARHFPKAGLNGYVEFLNDLPQDAKLDIQNETNLAKEMATSLKVKQTTNPLLQDCQSPLDPLILFGDDAQRETVRLSVLSLAKFKSDQSAARSFMNQLAMLLFSWIKDNPKPPGNRPLRGLLVIDEARDFVPSQKPTECKDSLMRLAAQARKYRLGLVFATQHPKDLETKIVGNCATHLYGLNNSPASLATLEDLMSQKGGDGKDIGQLKNGQFYVHNADAGHKSPIKTKIPMSLSVSPKNPLEESQILQKAEASRRKL